MNTIHLDRTRRTRLIAWLAVRVTRPRRLAAWLVNADMARAIDEGDERQRRRLTAALDWPGPASRN